MTESKTRRFIRRWSPKWADRLEKVHVGHGSHSSRGAGMCIMEIVSYLTGQPHNDHPVCVAPSITSAMVTMNDHLDADQRQRLKEVVPDIIGTRPVERTLESQELPDGTQAMVIVERPFTTPAYGRAEVTRNQILGEALSEEGLSLISLGQNDMDKALDVIRKMAAVPFNSTEVVIGDPEEELSEDAKVVMRVAEDGNGTSVEMPEATRVELTIFAAEVRAAHDEIVAAYERRVAEATQAYEQAVKPARLVLNERREEALNTRYKELTPLNSTLDRLARLGF